MCLTPAQTNKRTSLNRAPPAGSDSTQGKKCRANGGASAKRRECCDAMRKRMSASTFRLPKADILLPATIRPLPPTALPLVGHSARPNGFPKADVTSAGSFDHQGRKRSLLAAIARLAALERNVGAFLSEKADRERPSPSATSFVVPFGFMTGCALFSRASSETLVARPHRP
jgi:hypothetical protein